MVRKGNNPDRSAWQIQRERLHLRRERPPLPADSTAMIGDVLPTVMKQLGLEEHFWMQTLAAEWESLVGPQIAKQARPGRVDHKTLHVFVTHSAWLSELSRYGQKQILAKLQARFGADRIKNIRLQLDPDRR